MLNKNLSLSVGFLFLSCAHITPTSQIEENRTREIVKRTPSTPVQNERRQQAAPIYRKSKNDFLARKSTKTVDFWIGYFGKKNKDRLERFVANGEKYKHIIEETFQRYGLPKELYYVGLIESGYYNAARSHAGAVGPWQFIPSTARRYGLRVNSNIDERKNIFKSTEAAALYFQDLYNIFGSWELALAAYNKGENGIIRRIRGANTRDYYELCRKKVLPKETRHYVPKVLAVMAILENPERYDVKIKNWKENPFKDVVKMDLTKSVRISTMARKLNISSNLIKSLNQDLSGAYIPHPGRKPIEIYLPANSKASMQKFERYLASVKKIEKKRTVSTKTHIDYHKVRKNETLYSLSRRYNTSISSLKKLNNLSSSTIFVGQKIKIKSRSSSVVKYSYTVKKGDNLSKIARLFSLTISKLKKMNKLSSSTIFIGKKLQVPPHKIKIHTVKQGEFLGNIAKKNKVSLNTILNLNGQNKRIYPGQKIILALETI